MSAAQQPTSGRVLLALPLVLAPVLAAVAAAAVLVPIALGLPFIVSLLVLAGCLGAAALVLSLTRFGLFLVLLFALRPLLDVVKSPEQDGSSLGPSVAFGALFTLASLIWLARLWRSGSFIPLSWLSRAFIVLVLAAALSALVSIAPGLSATAIVRLLMATLMFIVLEQVIGTGLATHAQLMRGALASLSYVIVLCFVQLATGWHTYLDTETNLVRVTGPFVHPNVAAKYLVFMAIWLVVSWFHWRSPRQRTVILVVLGLVLVCLQLTYTRVAWGGAFIAILYILGRRDWRLVVGALVAAVVAAITVPAINTRVTALWEVKAAAPGVPANSMAWRLAYWEHLIPMARMTPFNGLGYGTTSVVGQDGLEPHNSWVQFYVETGWFGVGCLVALVICGGVTLRGVLRRSRSCSPSSLVRAQADAAVAAGIFLFIALQTENLFTETSTLWYSALLIVGGVARPPDRQASAEFETRGSL